MTSSGTDQPKDPNKVKEMVTLPIKEDEMEGMDERVAWKEVSSCRWSLVREQVNNKKRKPVPQTDLPRSFDTMSEYEALLREGLTEDIQIKQEPDGSEYRNFTGPSNIDIEGFSTDQPKDLYQGASFSEMVIKEEEVDEGMARIQNETEAAIEDRQVIARRVSSLANFTFIDRTNPITEASLLQITPFSLAEVLTSLKISRQVENVLGDQVRRIFRARRGPMRLSLHTPIIKRIRKMNDGNKNLAQVHDKKEGQSEEKGPEEPKIKEEELSDEDKSETSYIK